MDMTLDKRCGEQHAITDIYCAKRQRSLVLFPAALISLLVIGGVAAFLLTGFVGYTNCLILPVNAKGCWFSLSPDPLLLREPWPIYLWASAVMLTVQVAILRDPSLRRRLVLALVATLVSIAIVGIVYLFGSEIVTWLKTYYKQTLTDVVTSPTTYAVINFGIIILYALGSAYRWIRHPKGLTVVGAGAAIPRREASPDEATLEELISGDLITAVVLFYIMSLIFQDIVINGFITQVLGTSGPARITEMPISLSVTDLVLALLCLFMGFMALALTGLLAGLRVLQDQANPAASKAAGRVSSEVVLVILNALRAAFTRQLRNIVRRVGYTTRRALWPLLLLVGSFCLALFGRYMQYYLHYFDPTYNCYPGYVAQNHLTTCIPQSHWLVLLEAIGLGVAGLLATILSTALQLRSWRVAVNTFGFLRWVGLVALITLWIFAIALFAFNVLLLRLGVVPSSLAVPTGTVVVPAGVTLGACAPVQWFNLVVPLGNACTQPFVPLSYPTLISFVAFVVVVGILVVRLRQGVVRRVPSPAASASARGIPIPKASAMSRTDEGR